MKILLIEPNIEGYALMPTMSLAVLKSFINEKTTHSAKIIDLIFHKKDWKEHLRKAIQKQSPDLIGLSVLSFNYHQALEIARFIKQISNVKILFGGVHITLLPEDILKNKEVDFLCIGEGEETLKEILDKNFNCTDIKGVWYKHQGKIIKNPSRRLIENLDELPFPDWSDFDLEKYFLISNNHLPIMGSRGCPYSCTYCSNHALKKKLEGKYVRFRSVDNILDEIGLRIKQYSGKGLKYLFFYDDTFILDKNFVFEFCRKFKEREYHKLLKWNVNVRANLVTEEIIKSMKDAGCYEVRMGVEAANDYIRNQIYKRGMSKEQIYSAVKIIKKYNLQLRLQFIIGAPFESYRMMKESFDMAKKINADYTLFPILMPLPSTEIKEICEKEGLIEESEFKDSHSMYTSPVSRTKYASRKQIQNLSRKILLYQMKKYFFKGLMMKGPLFLKDLLVFFLYYKPTYDLEIDNAFRFTINKYFLEKLSRYQK